MTELKVKLIDGTEINETLSWGIHKELSNYLMEDGHLMQIFTNNEVTENLLQICFSERNSVGKIQSPFMKTSMLEVSSMLELLTDLHEYFENFFFQNQQRIATLEKKFQTLKDQTTNQ